MPIPLTYRCPSFRVWGQSEETRATRAHNPRESHPVT
jgi:hypothetical protein